jgi:UDP-arabinose 4-epimerase
METAKQTILVTGGAGYIGAQTCKALQRAGYRPVAYDNLIYGHRASAIWGPFEEGDILDAPRLREVMKKHRPAAVVHFAAFAYVGESVKNPSKYYWNNVMGSLTLLDVMREYGINRMVFSSTCATYGYPKEMPIPESHPQMPINPYGNTKLAIEKMLNDFDTAYGIRSISLRYFNAAGADPDGAVGEDHDPETHLIPLVLHAALGLRSHIAVYGNDYGTPDGTCIRDYVHVADLADAHVLALEALNRGLPSDAFNLGNGRGYSVKEVINAAQKITGNRVPIHIAPRRPGDPSCLVSDSRRARTVLGWQPRYENLTTILSHAWQWHRKRMDPELLAPKGPRDGYV